LQSPTSAGSFAKDVKNVSNEGLAMEDVGIFFGHLIYFTAIWYTLLDIWYIFPVFGMLYQDKSGNPVFAPLKRTFFIWLTWTIRHLAILEKIVGSTNAVDPSFHRHSRIEEKYVQWGVNVIITPNVNFHHFSATKLAMSLK
jgi:hypothetical protein